MSGSIEEFKIMIILTQLQDQKLITSLHYAPASSSNEAICISMRRIQGKPNPLMFDLHDCPPPYLALK